MRLCLCCALLLLPKLSLGADDIWRWIKVENSTSGWRVLQGDAEVSIVGGQFSAKLFLKGSDKSVAIRLMGKIESGKIALAESVQGSDFTGSNYHGDLSDKRWDSI